MTTKTSPTITISRDNVVAGTGDLIDGRIENCPAPIGEDVYAAIEDAIGEGSYPRGLFPWRGFVFSEAGAVEMEGVRWSWTIDS